MKKICMIVMLMMFSSTIVFATSGDVSGDATTQIIEKLIGENIMLAGDIVNAKGTAEDLIILAGDIVNSEAIGEYGFMAANNLNISGDVLKDNFVAGNVINVIGDVGRDAYLIGTTINIDGAIGRNVYAYGGEININGIVNGDISVLADKVFISADATIGGDIDITATIIEIEDGVKIGGLVTYNSNAEEVKIPDNVINNQNQVVDIEVKKENIFLSKIKDIILWILINIVLFVATMKFTPVLFERIEKVFKEKGGELYATSFGFGLLFLIVIPIIAIIALITVIGSALGFAGILAYIVIMVYSTIITGYLLGSTIFANKKKNKYLVGIIGIIAVEVLRNLPIIGGLLSFIITALAFGMIKEIMKKEISIVDGVN